MKMLIVPIGGCEQHGPHLPLAVDTIGCYEVAKRVSENRYSNTSSDVLMLTKSWQLCRDTIYQT